MEIVIWTLFSVGFILVALLTELYECILVQRIKIAQYKQLIEVLEKQCNYHKPKVKGQNGWMVV